MWLSRVLERSLVAAAASCLTLLLSRCRRTRKGGVNNNANLVSAYLQAIDQIKALGEGPPGVLHGDWGGLVSAAPPASMDISALKDGGSTSYTDGRGSIYRFKIGGDVIINMYFTKAGCRRSGDVHDCVQYDVVLRGRTRLRMLDPNTGQETVREYGAHDFIVIPARTPHMFEFLEDNYLLEWWGGEFAAWYYSPYRSIIERNLPMEDTANVDLSIDLCDLRPSAKETEGGKAGDAVSAVQAVL